MWNWSLIFTALCLHMCQAKQEEMKVSSDTCTMPSELRSEWYVSGLNDLQYPLNKITVAENSITAEMMATTTINMWCIQNNQDGMHLFHGLWEEYGNKFEVMLCLKFNTEGANLDNMLTATVHNELMYGSPFYMRECEGGSCSYNQNTIRHRCTADPHQIYLVNLG